MAGDEQERFEDYLELEHYIEDLQAGRPARLPSYLTPEKTDVYRMAVLFRSAGLENRQTSDSEAAEPRPAFVADLYAHLQELAADRTQLLRPLPTAGVDTEPQDDTFVSNQPTVYLNDQNARSAPGRSSGSPITPEPPVASDQDHRPAPPTPIDQDRRGGQGTQGTQQGTQGQKRVISRRGLFTGGAVAAASLAAGVAGGVAITRMTTPAMPKPWWPALVDGVPIDWHRVASLADIGTQAIKFVSEAVVGYVIYSDEKQEVVAFSAACTHMGCIVQWNDKTRRFDCPCHNGRFDEYGQPDPTSSVKYLVGLPGLKVQIEDGDVYVAVPKVSTQT